MSEEENTPGTHMLHAEYKDGQLQIVEVTPFERDKGDTILPDVITSDSEQKYMQVLDPSKGLVSLDLLNLTLVRCEDGEESYRLVTNSDDGADIPADGTVTCVLQTSDGEDPDNQDYVMVDGDQGLVFLQTASPPPVQVPETSKEKPKKKLTPSQILERAKALQKAKALMASQVVRHGRRGRRPAGDLPPPQELLVSPGFKLYLYSCKMCSYKCNATKDLQAHRAAEHGGGPNKYRMTGVGSRSGHYTLQCAKCPYRGVTPQLLAKHVQSQHLDQETNIASETVTFTNKVSLDSKEVAEADVLVCGACGFESSDRDTFRDHIEREHGATIT